MAILKIKNSGNKIKKKKLPTSLQELTTQFPEFVRHTVRQFKVS